MKHKQLPLLLLAGILLLGLWIRIYNVGSNPPGFFCDEASIGYNAYTILTYGKDEYGTSFPLFFRAFGEFKNPIATYSTVPFIYFFGLTEFATRLQAVFYGVLSIPLIFLVTRRLFHKTHYAIPVGLFAALFLAISPWHIHFSRVSLEGLTAFVFFTLLGLYFFLKAQQKSWWLIASAGAFCFALYSYFPARIFIPLFGLSLLFIYWRFLWKHKKQTLSAVGFAIVLLGPILSTLLFGEGFSRFQQVSIFANPPEDISIPAHILRNYFSHFSLDFLFLKGDIDMFGQSVNRHSVRGIGELYLLQLPLIILGIVYLVRKKLKREGLILLAWCLIAPTGSMFTLDPSAQGTRSIIAVIPWQILSAVGLVSLFSFIPKHKFYLRIGTAMIVALLILYSFSRYTTLYFQSYPLYAADFWGWQSGPKEIVSYFEKEKQNYDEFYMIGEFNAPYIFFRFYAPHGCENCKIGVPDEYFATDKKQLFAVTPTYITKHPDFDFTVKKTVYYPNNSVAFQIVEVHSKEPLK